MVGEAGGSVALLPTDTWHPAAEAALADAARLLGSLYDAVDCCDLPPEAVAAIERHAHIPVFSGLAHAQHPVRLLAAVLTISEWARQRAVDPSVPPCVRVLGDAASASRRAARIAVQAAGLALEGPARAGRPARREADFVLDPMTPSAAGRLTAVHAAAHEQARLAAMLAENEGAAVQAVIVSALR